MKSRYFLTSLYHETMRKIMEDALHDVELALTEKGVMTVRKVLLKGNPVKKLVEYASKNPIDMIVMSTSRNEMVPIGVIGSTARKIIAKTSVPVLVYTPLSPSEKIVVKRILILPIDTSRESMELLKRLVKDLVDRVKISISVYMGLSEQSSKTLISDLRREKIMCNQISEKITKPQELVELMEEHDLIVMPRCRKGIAQKVKTTIVKSRETDNCIDIVIAGLSPRPVLLV